jgi:hypothetical protein
MLCSCICLHRFLQLLQRMLSALLLETKDVFSLSAAWNICSFATETPDYICVHCSSQVRTMPDWHNLKLRNFKLTQFFKLKIWNNKIFETRAILFIAGSEVLWDEGGGRIMLGDNRRRGDSFMFESGFQLDFLPISTYSWPFVFWVPTSAKFDLHRIFWNVNTAQVGECLCTFVFRLSWSELAGKTQVWRA